MEGLGASGGRGMSGGGMGGLMAAFSEVVTVHVIPDLLNLVVRISRVHGSIACLW